MYEQPQVPQPQQRQAGQLSPVAQLGAPVPQPQWAPKQPQPGQPPSGEPGAPAAGEQQQPQQPKLEINGSRQFTEWLAGQRVSLAFTTYQTGKLFFIGLQPNGRLSVFERTFSRAMGLYATPDVIYLSTLYQLWKFVNLLAPGQTHEGYDRLYTPRSCVITGDIDVHDVAVDKDGNLVFCNTLFCCLATTDEQHSFRPIWQPPFLTKLAAEDRCHMNGLAMKDGRPKYVTAVSQSDVPDGWRDRRDSGGVIMDVDTSEVVCRGLSMPHSPRWHNGSLYVLNSGTGYFGRVNLEKGEFEPITFCAGYARGMAFTGNYAVIGLSRPRKNKTFSGLKLDDNLKEKDAEARCGLLIIDLKTGDIVQWLRIEGIVEELYDVSVIPGVFRPMAIGFKTDEIRRILSHP
ncbi:TIGR03032 family protein [Candidatus Poribacteria bacterium]|nr:TIGR03032 family protein [Candidatus Poribacteria bacterium]